MTTAITPTDENGLRNLIRDLVRRGKSYLDIEQAFGIPAARSEQIMRDYYKERGNGANIEEMRFLQLERFEMMIGPMMDRVEMGDVKAAEALIKLLSGINETIGLVKEQKSIEITIINQQQGEAVFRMIDFVGRELLKVVQAVVTDQNQLGEIEERWDLVQADSMGRAREQIVDAEVITE